MGNPALVDHQHAIRQRDCLGDVVSHQDRGKALVAPDPLQQPLHRDAGQRVQGFTAILVTHDVAEAVALADRVLVIDEGRIAHDVTVNAARPRERGSAELAGLEGSILSHLLSADDRT